MTFIRRSAVAVCLALWAPAALQAQAPAPAAEVRAAPREDVARLTATGESQLDAEDPVLAYATFRALLELDPDDVAGIVGLGRAELLLARPERAVACADRALALAPTDDRALALRVRALLRERRFDDALAASTAAVEGGTAGVEVFAAHASALFRMQRNDEAAAFYRRVLVIDPECAEAHLRLGSGLTAPRSVRFGATFARALDALRHDRLEDALVQLRDAVRADPENPVVHRLTGETLFMLRARDGMACRSPEFARVASLLPPPRLDQLVAAEFMPDLPALDGPRRAVATRALALFASRLPELVRKGGSHDLLGADERTTDASSRASLRGKRTFDGRVWDDVRGIGGLRAATGVEALDEALVFGFDTLAHEVAHQVHLHGFERRSIQVRIRQLYQKAVDEGRCLDYYAASNYAEYFGQGVEAFVSLVKRPAVEATHGHTRFELMRVDPELHALIAELVDVDPLRTDGDPAGRVELLDACVDAALRAGRVDDARTAAELLPQGARRDAALRRAEGAARALDAS